MIDICNQKLNSKVKNIMWIYLGEKIDVKEDGLFYVKEEFFESLAKAKSYIAQQKKSYYSFSHEDIDNMYEAYKFLLQIDPDTWYVWTADHTMAFNYFFDNPDYINQLMMYLFYTVIMEKLMKVKLIP